MLSAVSPAKGGTVVACEENALRTALAAGGQVTIACDGTIALGSPILIAANAELDATGQNVVLTGGQSTHLFVIDPGVAFALRGLILANGRNTNGGAIINAGTLEVTRCTFSNNVARSTQGTRGGAIYSTGDLRIDACAFMGNQALGDLDPAWGGAVYGAGPLAISRSYFADNRAVGGISVFFALRGTSGMGGALWGAAVAVTNSTFFANNAQGASATPVPPFGYSYGGDGQGGAIACDTAFLVHCTFAANTVGAGFGLAGLCAPTPPLCGGPGTAAGSSVHASAAGSVLYNNLLADANSSIAVVATSSILGGNVVGATPMQLLNPAANGGPTPTMAILPASPAVDAGDAAACPPTDQRGVARPAGSGCDVGAFEYDGPLRLPVLSAVFNPPMLLSSAVGTVALTVSNPVAVTLSEVVVTTRLPAQVFVAAGTPAGGCPGAILANEGEDTFLVQNLELAPFAACHIVIPIASASLGTWSNLVSLVSSPELGARSLDVPAQLIVGSPPLVATGIEQNIGPDSATLAGVVTPNGGPTVAWFDWGSTEELGNATAATEVGSAFVSSPFSAPITMAGLGAPVYFRAAASNALGVVYGEVRLFYTADGVVRLCTEEQLRANLAASAHVRFDCDGTIALSATLEIPRDTTIEASGHDVTLSGSNRVQVIHVPAGVHLTLRHMTIADGMSTHGGGIHNEGDLVLIECLVARNEARGLEGVGGEGKGGGVWNGGTLLANNTVFASNVARGGVGAPGASGGWAMDIIDQFGRCRTLVLPTSGTPGLAGGNAYGGGLFNEGSATLVATTLRDNACVGGNGGLGGAGGRGGCFALGTSGQNGGEGGAGAGAGVFNDGQLTVLDTTAHDNEARGGDGGQGGLAWGSFLIASGGGGRGGAGRGGAFWNAGAYQCSNTTLAHNRAVGGMGGPGGANSAGCFNGMLGSGGNSSAGAVGNEGTFEGAFLTVWNNESTPGLANTNTMCSPTFGFSNGVAVAVSLQNVQGTLALAGAIVGNLAAPNNCAGSILDQGANLGSDASAGFSAPDSKNNVNPLLGPLDDNGGPTLTFALQPNSPAFNAAVSIACLRADQRGVRRPMAGGCDIGAFEWVPEELRLTTIRKTDALIRLRGLGPPGASFMLHRSENLESWQPIGPGSVESNGLFELDDASGEPQQFYKVGPAAP